MRFKLLTFIGILVASAIAAKAGLEETITVTRIDRLETPASGYASGYRVDAYLTYTYFETANRRIDYRLACGMMATRIQTGQIYRVIPSYDRNGRYLIFLDVTEPSSVSANGKVEMNCTIESEKMSEERKSSGSASNIDSEAQRKETK